MISATSDANLLCDEEVLMGDTEEDLAELPGRRSRGSSRALLRLNSSGHQLSPSKTFSERSLSGTERCKSEPGLVQYPSLNSALGTPPDSSTSDFTMAHDDDVDATTQWIGSSLDQFISAADGTKLPGAGSCHMICSPASGSFDLGSVLSPMQLERKVRGASLIKGILRSKLDIPTQLVVVSESMDIAASEAERKARSSPNQTEPSTFGGGALARSCTQLPDSRPVAQLSFSH